MGGRTDGFVAVALGVLFSFGAIVLFFRFMVGYALYDLHLFFEPGSLMWGMVHTNFWLLLWLLGTLAGVIHKWAREEKIWTSGVQELREWRSR
ncbi:unnamed protein product [marine sediment metagenome]|uniref:Uncharacterized protein n=1 Tax=marine sediment metagenome TaxID=412755 RepID=X1U7A5_9ZZZZ